MTLTELRRVAEAATQGKWVFELLNEADQTYRVLTDIKNEDAESGPSHGNGWEDEYGGDKYLVFHDRHYYPMAPNARDAKYITTFDPPTVLQMLNMLDVMAGALEAADATLPYDTHLREMAHATIDNALAKYNAWEEGK